MPLLEHCGTGDPYPRTFLESRGMFADELACFPVAVASLDIEARDVGSVGPPGPSLTGVGPVGSIGLFL